MKKENTKQLDILQNVLNRTPTLDITRAVNTHIMDEERSG
jgi:hypothetical protein